MRIKILIISLFLFISCSVFGQRGSKFYGSLDFKLPTGVSNTAFRGIMGGVADLNASVVYSIMPKLQAGLGVKYGYFEVSNRSFQHNVTGRLELISPFFKIQYSTPMNDMWFFDAYVQSGPQKGITTTNQRPGSRYHQNSLHIEPGFGIYLKSSDNLSFGLIASYTYTTNKFTPENLNMAHFPSLSDDTSNGSISYFSIGFGFKAKIARSEN